MYKSGKKKLKIINQRKRERKIHNKNIQEIFLDKSKKT